MNNKQVKIGVVFSYTLIMVNALYGLFLTPFIISALGEIDYGVYKTISSLSSSLMVLDIGIGGTVLRYISKYKANKEENKIPNFMAMSLIQGTFISVLIILVCTCIFFLIEPIYSGTLNAFQIEKSKRLFFILSLTLVLHVFENIMNGAITGCNDFIFGNGTKILRILVKIILTIILLTLKSDSIVLVLIDFSLTLFLLLAETVYIKSNLKIKIKFEEWDTFVFKESFVYTMLMFLTSIAAQVNNNLDNVIIGAIKGPSLVTIYSIGLLIFSMFENLSTAISGVMLPTVSNILAEQNGLTKAESLVIKVGRIQFALLGAAFVGFCIIGNDFIKLWMGAGYLDAYYITLILMFPSLFELCVNVCLSILRAQNKLLFRTIVMTSTTIFNATVTYFSVKYWTYFGAAIGTAISFVIGSLVIMNIYYNKKLGLQMMKIYFSIMRGILPCLLISGAVIFASSRFIYGSWISFIVNVSIFAVAYLTTLLLFGFNKEERNVVFRILKVKQKFCK